MVYSLRFEKGREKKSLLGHSVWQSRHCAEIGLQDLILSAVFTYCPTLTPREGYKNMLNRIVIKSSGFLFLKDVSRDLHQLQNLSTEPWNRYITFLRPCGKYSLETLWKAHHQALVLRLEVQHYNLALIFPIIPCFMPNNSPDALTRCLAGHHGET